MLSCFFLHSTGDGGLSIPRVIINQLKWLDRIVDSKVVISVMTGLVACTVVTGVRFNRGVCYFADLFIRPVITYFIFISGVTDF